MRRLTPDQYSNIITDIFGSQMLVNGAFDAVVRSEGLIAAGTTNVGMTPAGFEQFDNVARSVAAQIVDPKNRATLIPCKPAAGVASDDQCATTFLSEVGRLLFRRPLEKKELDDRLAIARTAAQVNGDFYEGVAAALSSFLMSPSFLYVLETAEDDPAHPGVQRLNTYTKAARLSFLLWDTTPDETLLASAESGALDTRQGLQREVDRMLLSPRVQRGVRAFFDDMLSLDKFATLEKDPTLYPAFNTAVAQDAREQVLQTIADFLVVNDGDYRDLMTTRKTFLSDALARLYRVPAPNPGGWGVYRFADDDPRIGIQTSFAFTALNAHPGRSSPTLRGRAIRELLLCQKIPDPPSNVDFSLFTNPNAVLRTARQRLEAHSVNAACAGCHKLMDPVGLALENFDGAGQLRTSEGGAPIDPSGMLDGRSYNDTQGLAKALHDTPALPACLVTRLYTYAIGRKVEPTERAEIESLQKRFADAGFRVPKLLRAIATDAGFYQIPPHDQRRMQAENSRSESVGGNTAIRKMGS
jgi:hypothetical protein